MSNVAGLLQRLAIVAGFAWLAVTRARELGRPAEGPHRAGAASRA